MSYAFVKDKTYIYKYSYIQNKYEMASWSSTQDLGSHLSLSLKK